MSNELDEKSENDRILEDRAKQLAKVPKKEQISANTIEVTTFRLGSELYGLESAFVKEVIKAPPLTPFPLAPSFVLGLTNLRGEILMAIDLLSYLGVDRDITGFSDILVLGEKELEFGLVAHQAREVRKIQIETIADPPDNLGRVKDYMKGVFEGNLIVLDAKKLFNDKQLILGDK